MLNALDGVSDLCQLVKRDVLIVLTIRFIEEFFWNLSGEA